MACEAFTSGVVTRAESLIHLINRIPHLGPEDLSFIICHFSFGH